MKGIPKGLCSFGGVQRRRLRQVWAEPKETKALRKG